MQDGDAQAAGQDGAHERAAVPLALLCAALGATNMVAIKGAYRLGFQPLAFGGLRCVVVVALAALALKACGQRLVPKSPGARRALGVECGLKAVGALPIYLALWLLPASSVLILSFARPVVLSLVAGRWLEDRIEARRASGLGLGILALVLVVGAQEPHGAAQGWRLWGGLGLAVAGLLTTSVMAAAQKRAFAAGATPLQSVLASSLGPAVLWPLVAPWVHPVHWPSSSAAWGVFAYTCTGSGVVLFTMRRFLVSRYRVSFLSTFAPASRGLALLLAWWGLGEVLPGGTVGGVVVLVAGGALSWPRSAGARVDRNAEGGPLRSGVA